jgi:uncharacterized metal-binding protein
MVMFWREDGQLGTPPAGSANVGQATIAFSTFMNEDAISVTGQAAIAADSRVALSLLSDTDDVVAQDWCAPYVTAIVAGIGFTINLRAAAGTFAGPVKVNWSWV